jgi:PAS domain-containing protein
LQLWRYLGAVLVTAVAVLGRYALEPWLGTAFPFITFFPAVAIVAWLAGVGPAILSAALAVVAANMLFLPASLALDLSVASWVGIHLIYLVASALIIAAGGVAYYRQVGRGAQILGELRESEMRFRHIADNMPLPLWMSNQSKEGTYFNDSWLKFTGRTIDQELGFGWMESLHPDDIGALDVYELAFKEQRPFSRRRVSLDARRRRAAF